MGKPSAPKSPDYAGAAQQQGQENTGAAYTSAVLSNPNITTPYGTQTVDWPNGTAQANITQTLNPTAQQIFDTGLQSQLGLGNLANQQIGNVSSILNTPFQFGGQPQGALPDAGPIAGASPYGTFGTAQGAPALPSAQGSFDESNVAKMPINAGTTAQQLLMQRLQPQLDQQRKSYENQLAQQGLVPGGEAYDNSIRNLGQQENDARTQAALQGIGLDLSANQQGFGQALQRGQFGNQAAGQNAGQLLAAQGLNNAAIGQNTQSGLALQQGANAAQQQGFNQLLQSGQFGNQALQQALAMALQQRELPLNEISALMSGSQVQNPAFQGYQGQQAAPAPVFGAAQAQGAFDMNAYQQQVAQRNALLGGLFGLGGAATTGLFGLAK